MKTPVLVSVFSIAIVCGSSFAMAETAPSNKGAPADASSVSKGKSKDMADYLSGTFVSVEPAKTMNNRIHKAIESVVGRMSIFTKGKARSNLRNLTKPCMNFTFELENKKAIVQCEERDENAAPADGKKIKFYNKNGNREDIYEFIDGGERMVVHTRISSKWLNRDVRYALYFERGESQKAGKSTQAAKK